MKFQRIRDLKEDSDLTQNQISKIIGVSENQYGRYERGESPITLDKALILADYYRVSLDYIAGRTNDKKGLTKSQLSEDVSHLVKSYEFLSERRKGKLELFIQQLVEEQENENAQVKDVI